MVGGISDVTRFSVSLGDKEPKRRSVHGVFEDLLSGLEVGIEQGVAVNGHDTVANLGGKNNVLLTIRNTNKTLNQYKQ